MNIYIYIIEQHYPCEDKYYKPYTYIYRIYSLKKEALTKIFELSKQSIDESYISNIINNIYNDLNERVEIIEYKLDKLDNNTRYESVIYNSKLHIVTDKLEIIERKTIFDFV